MTIKEVTSGWGMDHSVSDMKGRNSKKSNLLKAGLTLVTGSQMIVHPLVCLLKKGNYYLNSISITQRSLAKHPVLRVLRHVDKTEMGRRGEGRRFRW